MVTTGCVFALTGALLLAGSIAMTGEWNFQGGERRTYYAQYPFEDSKIAWDAIGQNRATDGVEILFDRRVFWTHLSHNLLFFVAGRYSGMLPYYFPGLFAAGAFLLARRKRRPWQWLVLGAAVAEYSADHLDPRQLLRGGGAVGNRYFMGAYGAFLFLLPPIQSVLVGFVPWVVDSSSRARLS